MSNQALQIAMIEELEQEYSWRTVEFEKIENILNEKAIDEVFCEVFRKTLIIMLYAYFEGYCKSALSIYAGYVNRLRLPVSAVTDGLACSALYEAFSKLLDSYHKPIDLGTCLKEDNILQTFGRRKEFVSQYAQHGAKIVQIPDKVIETESNLKSHVLKKILFCLDMDYTIVDQYQTEINELVNKRNSFAHGDRRRSPDLIEYNRYKDKTFGLMRTIKQITYEHYCNEKYLKR